MSKKNSGAVSNSLVCCKTEWESFSSHQILCKRNFT